MLDPLRFARACALFEAAHARDPEGKASVYHAKLAAFVERLAPQASEPLRLAARCQHINRHQLPRSGYPMDTLGYKRWRSDLARRHADEARATLASVGYEAEVAERVADLLQKKRLRTDPDVMLFEDAICLTFLELELSSFAAKHPAEKVIDILQKTWAKMSDRGQREAAVLALGLAPELQMLIERALHPD